MQYPLNSKVYNPEYQSQKQKNLKNISFRLNHQTKFITAHKIQNPCIDKHRKDDIFYDFPHSLQRFEKTKNDTCLNNLQNCQQFSRDF